MMHRKFWLVLFALLGGFAWAGDTLLGWISDTSETRVAARQFREEAAYLELSTKNLIPNTEHVYRDWDSSQSADQRPSVQIRRFQTDPNGLVVDNPDGNFHKVTILFLGGSTTECNEVAEELRFPTVVQRRLREAGLDVATANAGVRGQSNGQNVFNDIIREVARRDQVTLIDLDNAIGEVRDSAFFFDKIHLNNRGSRFVGEIIASSLAPLVN
jgi:hypothetical protein